MRLVTIAGVVVLAASCGVPPSAPVVAAPFAASAIHHAIGLLMPAQEPGRPFDLVADRDGNIYFSEVKAPRIGRLTPANRNIKDFQLPTGLSAGMLSVGLDGKIWFTEYTGSRIGSLDPASGGVAVYTVPTLNPGLACITLGPGGNLWFTESLGNRIGRITPEGEITEYSLPHPDSGPYGIAAAPDGNIWFTEFQGNRVGRFILRAGVVEGRSVSAGTFVTARPPFENAGFALIVAAPNGNVWFEELNRGAIGVYLKDGGGVDLPLKGGGTPLGLAVTAASEVYATTYDPNMYFHLEPDIGKAGAIWPRIGEAPGLITIGPDGCMWFAERRTPVIGRMCENPAAAPEKRMNLKFFPLSKELSEHANVRP